MRQTKILSRFLMLSFLLILLAGCGTTMSTAQPSTTTSAALPSPTITRTASRPAPTATSVPATVPAPEVPQSLPSGNSGITQVNLPTSAPTVVPTDPTAVTPQPTIVDTTTDGFDQLPTNMSYYCNRIHLLGGKWPMHLYVGDCLITMIKQYSWSVDSIKNLVNNTLCAENMTCTSIVNTLSYFIHQEITHVANESAQCGNRGIYVHVFGGFFRTHPVCQG